MLLQKSKMNLLKLKVFFLSTLLQLCALTTTAQESPFDTMVNALISENVPVLSVEELQTKRNIILLDTRTKAEYDVSHIDNAIWVGEKDWDLKSFEKFNKEQTVVVYCSIGYRSEKLVKKLLRLDFEKTFNLYGGVFDWVNKGYPVENNRGLTDSIHGYDKSFARWLYKGVVIF